MDLCEASNTIRENFYRQEEKGEQEGYTTTTTTTITTTTTVYPSQYARDAPHLVTVETPQSTPSITHGRLNIMISSAAASEADTCPGGSCKSAHSIDTTARTPISLFGSDSGSDQQNLFFQSSPETPKEVQVPPSRVLKEVRKDTNGRFTTTHVPRSEAAGFDGTYKKVVTHVADTHRKKVTCPGDAHDRGWEARRHSSLGAADRASDRKPPQESDSSGEEDEGAGEMQGLLIESRFMSMKSGLTPQHKRSRNGRKKERGGEERELDFRPIGNTNTIYQNATLMKAMESKTFSAHRKNKSPMALSAKGPSSFFTQLKDFTRNPISEIKRFSRYAVSSSSGDGQAARAPCMPKVAVVMRLMGGSRPPSSRAAVQL